MSFPVYKQHPLSACFPPLTDKEVQAMAEDIAVHGLRDPITLYEGKVLDGWHRWQACYCAKVIPRTVEYKGKNPVEYVKSKNWFRRHMTEGQRTSAILNLEKWISHGGDRSKSPMGDLKSREELAESAGVGPRSIDRGRVVKEHGGKAVNEALDKGEISLRAAERIARKPKREQKSLIMAPPPDAPSYTKEDALEDEIKELRSALALKHTPEDERVTAKELIDDLNGKIKVLEVKLRAVTLSRDTLQNENARLKQQITRQRKEIDKLAGTRTA